MENLSILPTVWTTNKTIQGVKKAHVQGRSESASRGKELHDRAINPHMNGVFVQERSSTT